MNDSDEALTGAAREALDAHAQTLPPGVATRLAAARAEALATRSGEGWFERLFGGAGGWAGAALGGAAVLALALVLLPDAGPEPMPVAERIPPEVDASSVEGDLALEDLDVAAEIDLMEELEFMAWLALEDGALEPVDAG